MKKPISMHVVGRGNMARLILNGTEFLGVSSTHHPHYDDWNIKAEPNPIEFCIAVHCGSGKQFPLLFQECNLWGTPLIQLSSSLKDGNGEIIPMPVSTEVSFPFINAPNLALPVTALLKVLPEYGKMIQKIGGTTTVWESHQASKTSAPVTAQIIAGYFGTPPEEVESIRRPIIQKEILGVPEAHLDGHARHGIGINACGMNVNISFGTNGRHPYLEGLGVLIRKIIEMGDKLHHGVHQADELIFG